ncbi:glycosyltransferase family 2 protein [Alkalihalobacillus sp. AL-G]|uniref:glycosyltransferase family 2 protein n=1 Tax=Alkalihalobacillus sp. AL-G TaxID=2926399 RepID=UPI00272AC932|nr:glycosyltransferase family 2 protein [Alkalihalobacillus sp. AL-G]WLD94957.1 glycosyltransferase family 2 protein [Alkalihalobacillus sp. AL-G]
MFNGNPIKIGKRKVDISIIIPTFNKFPQNLFTLFSLEKQNFKMSKFEVIVVDDGSTDTTDNIPKQYQFPFEFKYIKCKKNIGRAAARNLGIRQANGKVLIFLDAEIIVEPDFLDIHYTHHQKNSNLVVSGIMTMNALYSVLFPDFSIEQLNQFETQIKHFPEYQAKYEVFKKQQKRTLLIDRNDIHSGKYKNLASTTLYEEFYRRVILSNYGFDLQGYRIPWQLFGTGHVSVSKRAIEQVGLFKEYSGYGWDDCEMGYRLYKNGATFTSDENLISYHQEHPVSAVNHHQSKQNYYLFQETYKEIDQMIISLTFLPVPKNLHEVNQLLTNYQMLCNEFPDQFSITKRVFSEMLRKIGWIAKKNSLFTNLCTVSDSEKKELELEIQMLKKLKRFSLFIQCFEELQQL